MPPVNDIDADAEALGPLLGPARARILEASAALEAEQGLNNNSDGDAHDNAMTEKAASTIPIDDFDSTKDDFDDWIERFEAAVRLACKPQTDARRNALYLEWLSLKLDAAARGVLRQIPEGTAYLTVNDMKGVKDHLKELLVDPGDVYRWRAMKKKITWDGKECFQTLATRVIRAVDKYEKECDQRTRNMSYFFRFREALPKVYQNAIDLSIGKEEQTIENAKELAGRVKLTRSDHKDSVDCAAMSDPSVVENRVKGLELEISGLRAKLDNLRVSPAGAEGGGERRRDRSQSRSSYSSRRDGRGRDGYDGDDERRGSRDFDPPYQDYRRGRDRDDRYDDIDRRQWEERRRWRRDWDRCDDRYNQRDRCNRRGFDRRSSSSSSSPSPSGRRDQSRRWGKGDARGNRDDRDDRKNGSRRDDRRDY